MAYIVKSGDTLSKIAKEYGLNWRELGEANGIMTEAQARRLQIGQELKIPEKLEMKSAQPLSEQSTLRSAGDESVMDAFNAAVGEKLERLEAKGDQNDLSAIARPDNVPIRKAHGFETSMAREFNVNGGDLGTTTLKPIDWSSAVDVAAGYEASSRAIVTKEFEPDWVPDNLYIHAASSHLGGSGVYGHQGQVHAYNEVNPGVGLG